MSDEKIVVDDPEFIDENEAKPDDQERLAQIEKEAALLGHVPKEQFRGDPEDFVDAETFLRRGREIMPILRKNNERLTNKVLELEQTLVRDRGTFEEFRKFQEAALEKQKADTLEQLRTARKEAIAMADGDAFELADERIKQVEAYKPPPREQEPPPLNPEFVKWLEDNSWYTKDKALMAVADSLIDVVSEEGLVPGSTQFLDEIARRVRTISPAKFNNPARLKPANVDAPAPRARKPNGRGYDELPQEAKEMCDRFVNAGTIKGYTRDMYVRDYQW